jgi:hypothetical protein
MKLSQLGLTPTGQKATKKLGRQVHKATVAAAMEPKLRLGVLGIEIGQEQSTGPTSRVNEALEPNDAAALAIKTAKFLKYDGKLPPATATEAWQVAIRIGQLYDADDSDAANLLSEALEKMEGRLRSYAGSWPPSVRLVDWADWLGVTRQLKSPPNVVTSYFEKLEQAHREASAVSKQATKLMSDVRGILNFFDYMTAGLSDEPGAHEFDSLEVKTIKAVAAKLGFKV